MYKKIIIAFFFVVVVGCSTSRVIPIGDDVYIVTSSGAGFSTDSVIENVYEAANQYCLKSNQKAKTTNLKTRAGKAASNPPSAELSFRCVSPLTDIEISVINNKAEQCLITNSIIYDDGISDVSTLSKAALRQCYKPCVKAKLEQFGGKESDYYKDCLNYTENAIFVQRNMKRQGGDFRQFLDFTYAKRRGDGHFQNRIYTFDKEYSSKLILSCIKDVTNESLSSHSLSLTGNAVSALNINKKLTLPLKLSVNGNKIIVIYNKENNAIYIPLVKVDEVINSSIMTVENGANRITFKTAGYIDSINKMKSECPTIN